MISAAASMGEIMEKLPGARRALFSRYHLGGCNSCAFSDSESLGELCARSELETEEVLSHLLASHELDAEMLMEPADVKLRLDGGENIRVVDVRTREEHEAVKIPGSEFFTAETQGEFFSLPPETLILIYDHMGKSVLDQVAWFRGHGMKETYGLRGGIDAWSSEIDSTVQRYRLEVDSE